MRAFQQSPTVRLHHWGWVDEHLYVVIDNVVQQRSTLGYDSPVCSSRSLMKCTWSQQDILYTVDNASVYKYLFCVGLLRFSHKNNDWLENERPTLYLTSYDTVPKSSEVGIEHHHCQEARILSLFGHYVARLWLSFSYTSKSGHCLIQYFWSGLEPNSTRYRMLRHTKLLLGFFLLVIFSHWSLAMPVRALYCYCIGLWMVSSVWWHLEIA